MNLLCKIFLIMAYTNFVILHGAAPLTSMRPSCQIESVARRQPTRIIVILWQDMRQAGSHIKVTMDGVKLKKFPNKRVFILAAHWDGKNLTCKLNKELHLRNCHLEKNGSRITVGIPEASEQYEGDYTVQIVGQNDALGNCSFALSEQTSQADIPDVTEPHNDVSTSSLSEESKTKQAEDETSNESESSLDGWKVASIVLGVLVVVLLILGYCLWKKYKQKKTELPQICCSQSRGQDSSTVRVNLGEGDGAETSPLLQQTVAKVKDLQLELEDAMKASAKEINDPQLQLEDAKKASAKEIKDLQLQLKDAKKASAKEIKDLCLELEDVTKQVQENCKSASVKEARLEQQVKDLRLQLKDVTKQVQENCKSAIAKEARLEQQIIDLRLQLKDVAKQVQENYKSAIAKENVKNKSIDQPVAGLVTSSSKSFEGREGADDKGLKHVKTVTSDDIVFEAGGSIFESGVKATPALCTDEVADSDPRSVTDINVQNMLDHSKSIDTGDQPQPGFVASRIASLESKGLQKLNIVFSREGELDAYDAQSGRHKTAAEKEDSESVFNKRTNIEVAAENPARHRGSVRDRLSSDT